MEQLGTPSYVLRFNEAVLMTVDKKRSFLVIKICAGTVIGIIPLGTVLFKDNLFAKLSGVTKVLLFILAVRFGFYKGKKEYCPSPMEIWFYDDYFVEYKQKRCYSDRQYRKEIAILRYSDVTRVCFYSKSKRFHIYGSGRSIWYVYKQDGTFPQKPTKDKLFSGGLLFFNISLESEVDVISEIESHSPMKVTIEKE